MKKSTFKSIALIGLASALSFTSCSEKDDDEIIVIDDRGITIETPVTYEFTRDGLTSVSYSGQTERLDQLATMKTYIQDAIDNGTQISAQALKDMFENTGGNGNGNFSFSSTKQLSNKTFSLDVQGFNDMFDLAAAASDSAIDNVAASNGVAGKLTRSNGKVILVDANGHEFTQELEKGLMGATLYNQIVNSYLTEEKIGAAVNNTDLVAGKNYTTMEHHFDEAFGYYAAPVDFKTGFSTSESPRYWASYSEELDATFPFIDRIMNSYKKGRAAIAAKKYSIKDAEVAKLHESFQILIAASAIHYINSAISESNTANRLHVLSEGFFFLKSLRYSNSSNRKITQAELDTMLNTDFGNNFWNISSTGLNAIKTKLSSTYGLDSVKDQL
jgi:hypothetical protein